MTGFRVNGFQLNKLRIFFLFIFSITCSSCTTKKKENNQEAIRPVKFYTVHFENATTGRTYVGVSAASQEIDLSFRVGGKISQTFAKVGQHVEKGQLLATLDSHDLKLKYEQSMALKNQAKVKFSTSASNLRRSKQLYETNAIPLSEYEKSRDAYAAAKSSYEESIKGENLAKHQLDYTSLYASISGIISAKEASVNENIQSGKRMYELSSSEAFEVVVGIPSSYIDFVKEGEKVELRFSTISNKLFDGVVSQISYEKSSSSTYPVTVEITNPSKALRPGLASEVMFKPRVQGENELLIPNSAVFEDTNGRTYVYTITTTDGKQGVVHKKLVVLGELNNFGYEVKSGLSYGDKIVTAGVSNMKEGLEVKLLKPQID